MKILFVMLNPGYVRNYEAVIRELARRGHRIHIAHQADRNKMGEKAFLHGLAQEFATVTGGRLPEPVRGFWRSLARSARALLDYSRYLDRRYATAFALRERLAKQLPAGLVLLANLIGACGELARLAFMRVLIWAEWRVPRDPIVSAFLDEHAPDVVLVTPLVELASAQTDYVKECAFRGIPTALCVASWDNLTNKGHIRIAPDRVIVWNDAQRREAVELHGVPPERVIISGAQMFDHWFEWVPTRTREEFCARVGLDAARPIVLYLGSSYFIAPNEAAFVDRWIRALRRSETVGADANVLIRPHPGNSQQFLGLDLSQIPRVTVWPPFTANFYTEDSKADFFESMFYSTAVVGVNTSALIEAAIVGRSCCTVLAPDFAHSQEGTLHFHLLSDGDSALLKVASDFETHFAQLAEAMSQRDGDRARIQAFVRSFVRPHGLDKPAVSFVVDAIERTAELAVEQRRAPILDPALRALLAPPTAVAALLWMLFDVEPEATTRYREDLTRSAARRCARVWFRWTLAMTQFRLGRSIEVLRFAVMPSKRIFGAPLIVPRAEDGPQPIAPANNGNAAVANGILARDDAAWSELVDEDDDQAEPGEAVRPGGDPVVREEAIRNVFMYLQQKRASESIANRRVNPVDEKSRTAHLLRCEMKAQARELKRTKKRALKRAKRRAEKLAEREAVHPQQGDGTVHAGVRSALQFLSFRTLLQIARHPRFVVNAGNGRKQGRSDGPELPRTFEGRRSGNDRRASDEEQFPVDKTGSRLQRHLETARRKALRAQLRAEEAARHQAEKAERRQAERVERREAERRQAAEDRRRRQEERRNARRLAPPPTEAERASHDLEKAKRREEKVARRAAKDARQLQISAGRAVSDHQQSNTGGS